METTYKRWTKRRKKSDGPRERPVQPFSTAPTCRYCSAPLGEQAIEGACSTCHRAYNPAPPSHACVVCGRKEGTIARRATKKGGYVMSCDVCSSMGPPLPRINQQEPTS